jgi:hypothetical protein
MEEDEEQEYCDACGDEVAYPDQCVDCDIGICESCESPEHYGYCYGCGEDLEET